jgi:riboflavin kinase/FMN adenylyltransferase
MKLLCANPDIVVDRGESREWCAGAVARLYEEMGRHRALLRQAAPADLRPRATEARGAGDPAAGRPDRLHRRRHRDRHPGGRRRGAGLHPHHGGPCRARDGDGARRAAGPRAARGLCRGAGTDSDLRHRLPPLRVRRGGAPGLRPRRPRSNHRAMRRSAIPWPIPPAARRLGRHRQLRRGSPGHQAVLELARPPRRPLGVVTLRAASARMVRPRCPPLSSDERPGPRPPGSSAGVEPLFELPLEAPSPSRSPEEFVGDPRPRTWACRTRSSAPTSASPGPRRRRRGAGRAGPGGGHGGDVGTHGRGGEAELSSTAIPQALSEGRPRDAAADAGPWHRSRAGVTARSGATLATPPRTCARRLHRRASASTRQADVLDGPHAGSYGAPSIGVRPCSAQPPNCETFLFDFAGDLYGATLSSPRGFPRPEMSSTAFPR